MATKSWKGGPVVTWRGQQIELPAGSTVDADGTIHFPGARGEGAKPGTTNYEKSLYAVQANQALDQAGVADPHARMLSTLTWQAHNDPSFQMPEGFKKDDNGNVIVDEGSWLARNFPYLLLAGVGGAAGLAAVGAFGGGAAAAGAGASSAGAAGAGAAGAGAAGASAAGAAGTAGVAGAHAASLFGVPAATLFTAGTSLFGNLFGAWMQGKAADKAAASEAEAARYAAGLQDAASQRALQFQREQAENAFQNNEAARRGNYDLDAAHQRRLGYIGEEVGLGPREIPAYVPGVDPGYTSGGAAPGTIGAHANVDLSGARATLDRLFPGETLTPEMLASKRAELEAAGFTLNPNAHGQITDLSYQGVNIDPIEGAGSGLNRKQFLVQTPGAAPAAAASARPVYVSPSVPFLSSTRIAPTLGYMGAY